MTYTYKLARRLARLRKGAALFPSVRTTAALLVPLLAACAAGEPFDPNTAPPIDNGTDGPVAVSPRQVTLEGSQGVLFKAFESLIPGSSQVTSIEWTATGGTIDAQGSYTPGSTGAFKIVGRRKGNPHNPPDTSIVVVVPPQPTLVAVELTPAIATVGGGLQQQFAAVGRRSDGTEVPIGVQWTATGGTIDAGGLYTAGRSAGTYKVIATHVTTHLADTAVVTVPPATLTSITLTPATTSLGAGQGIQFTASGRLSDGTISTTVPVAYAASGGSISINGYYTAGSASGTYRVIATAQGGKADTSAVTIMASAPPPSSLLLYNADFESGGWPSGTGIVQCVPGRITLYTAATKPFSSSPNPRRGTYASKFETRDSDDNCGGTSSSRSQISSPRYLKQGGEYWITESVYFPTDLPSIPSWFMFTELYYTGCGQPAVAFYLNNQGANISFNSAYNPATQANKAVASFPIGKGTWHDFLLHVKISTDPTVGFVELWRNGVNVPLAGGVTTGGVSRLTAQTMNWCDEAGGSGLILNDYRSSDYPTSTGVTMVYFDEARIGTTRDAVNPPGGSWSPSVVALQP